MQAGLPEHDHQGTPGSIGLGTYSLSHPDKSKAQPTAPLRNLREAPEKPQRNRRNPRAALSGGQGNVLQEDTIYKPWAPAINLFGVLDSAVNLSHARLSMDSVWIRPSPLHVLQKEKPSEAHSSTRPLSCTIGGLRFMSASLRVRCNMPVGCEDSAGIST